MNSGNLSPITVDEYQEGEDTEDLTDMDTLILAKWRPTGNKSTSPLWFQWNTEKQNLEILSEERGR